MPADSLLEIATRACCRMSKRITDVGDIPYALVRPVLLKVESPEQLHQIETNSPQIIGRDSEIWLAFIKRDVPDWQLYDLELQEPRNWWKLYKRLKKESQKAMAQGADKLKAALENLKNEKEQNLAQLVNNKNLPKPGPSMRQRIVHGYISGRTGSKGASKLSLMEKIRREARDSRRARLALPMHELKKKSSGVTAPPQQFVEDLKNADLQRTQALQRRLHSPERKIRAPRTPTHASRPTDPSDLSYRDIRDREARLRALTSGKSTPATTNSHHAPSITIENNPESKHTSSTKPRRGSSTITSEPFGSDYDPTPISTSRIRSNRPTTTSNSDSIPSHPAELSASFLESPGLYEQPTISPSRKALSTVLEGASLRARSPVPRIASPQPPPNSLKRKHPPPSPFMTPPKKVVKRPPLANGLT